MFQPKFVLFTIAMLLLFLSVTSSNSAAQAASVFTTLAAGDAPSAVAVNPATNMIYVVNQDSDNVTVIDGDDNTTTVTVGDEPGALAVNPVTNKIYVTNELTNNVTVIDGDDNSTTTVAVGVGPVAVAVNPETDKVYVANATSGTVTVIDGSDNTATTVNVGVLPRAVAVNPETNRAYVANRESGTVTVIDGSDNSIITTVAVGELPSVVAVNPETNRVYVANERSDDVTVIDGSDNSVTTTVTAGNFPIAVAVNSVTNMVYVANKRSGTVTVINGSDHSATTVDAGNFPSAVAVDPVINQIYVANRFGGDLTVIDGSDNSTTTLPVGNDPAGVAVNPESNKVYVTNFLSDTVTVINGQDQSQDQSQADFSLTLFQDPADGATGVKLRVGRVFDPATDQDVALRLHDFQARLSYDSSCIRVLDVRGEAFEITDFFVDIAGGVATFTGTAPSGVTAPADLGLALTRLRGSALVSCPLTLQVTSLNDSDGNSIQVPDTVTQNLLRGDARPDGRVTIADALYIAQYLAELRTACTDAIDNTCLHSVNAASVLSDGAFDKKTIADASFIAQHLVGLRDEVYGLDSVAFDLIEENGSGQSGRATLTSRNGQTEVRLNLSAGTFESELVHIHSGQCGISLGDLVHPLTSFVDGSGESVTTVNAPLSSFLTGDFAINTHKKGDSSTFTACGNIPATP